MKLFNFFVALLGILALTEAGTRCPSSGTSEFCRCRTSSMGLTSIRCIVDDTNIGTALKIFSDENMIIDSLKIVGEATKIPAQVFGNARVIRLTINLKNLTEISDEAFNGQEHNMHSFALFGSQMEEFFSTPLAKMRRLTNLKIVGNRAMEVISIDELMEEELESIIIARNAIDDIFLEVGSRFQNLKNLQLNSNKLTPDSSITIENSTKIKSLDLSSNNFNTIPIEIFENLPKGAKINLRRIRVNNITEEHVETIINKRFTVNLQKNPLNCGCDLKWITKYNKKRIFKINGICSKPRKVRGMKLRKLSRSDFSNCNDN